MFKQTNSGYRCMIFRIKHFAFTRVDEFKYKLKSGFILLMSMIQTARTNSQKFYILKLIHSIIPTSIIIILQPTQER